MCAQASIAASHNYLGHNRSGHNYVGHNNACTGIDHGKPASVRDCVDRHVRGHVHTNMCTDMCTGVDIRGKPALGGDLTI